MENSRRPRRQHRSCDQCRKGKRACDAAIRKDSLLLPSSYSSASFFSPSNLNHRGSNHADLSIDPCSNCTRWKKECTFDWLCSFLEQKMSRDERRKKGKVDKKNATRQTAREKKCVHTAVDQNKNDSLARENEQDMCHGDDDDDDDDDDDALLSAQWLPESLGGEPFFPFQASNLANMSWDQAMGSVPGPWGESSTVSNANTPGTISWNAQNSPCMSDHNVGESHYANTDYATQNIDQLSNSAQVLSSLASSYTKGGSTVPQAFDSLGLNPTLATSNKDTPHTSSKLRDSATRNIYDAAKPRCRNNSLSSSQALASQYARVSMTQDLLRIYHDSLENALSCWLTERNCPYSASNKLTYTLVSGLRTEWGPNWSNRICTRVCRLDRAYAAVRGRKLSAAEEKAASRTLHTSIMAFAVQWTHNSRERMNSFGNSSTKLGTLDGSNSIVSDDGFPSSVGNVERSVQENLWNQAQHALKDSSGILSFRVAFANVIFSLTQRPLTEREHASILNSRSGSSRDISYGEQGQSQLDTDSLLITEPEELHELFDNDPAPSFMETALRQLFTFRYQLTRHERQKPLLSSSKFPGRDPTKQQQFHDAELGLASPEDQETINLLFWLGIMFDTLTAAMHQRPPVVSDEDSQITCVASSSSHLQTSQIGGGSTRVDLDGWDAMSGNQQKKQDVWGDFFLQAGQTSKALRWPCTYEEAAEILSDAAPVKVLLFRRVSGLQTLIYRGVTPDRLEKAIQDTLVVYQYWNSTYGHFIINCIIHHDSLPMRIQTWYTVIAGHYHLAAMLLADTLESIDQAQLGLETGCKSRGAIGLVPKLRRDNALVVCSLARCSLHRPDGHSKPEQIRFHDSVNHGAFLTEPWTAVLIRSFTKAGYIVLDEIDTGIYPYAVQLEKILQDGPLRQVGYCVDALWCLGRKSDMACLAARVLSNSLGRKIQETRLLQVSTIDSDIISGNFSGPGTRNSGNSSSTVTPGYSELSCGDWWSRQSRLDWHEHMILNNR